MSIFEHSSKFVVISKKFKISIKSFSYYADNNPVTFYLSIIANLVRLKGMIAILRNIKKIIINFPVFYSS